MYRFIAYLLIVQLSIQPFLLYFNLAEANAGAVSVPPPIASIAPVATPVVAPVAAPLTPVPVAAPSAVATVQQGLSWLNQSLQNSAGMSGGVMSAEAAATHLGQAGATQAQAQTIIQNQIANGNVAPPAQPQGFWSRIASFGKQTGANAQMSINRVGQALDFKPYTEVQLSSGSTLRWNQSATNSYQVLGEQGQVLNRSAVDGSANAKAIRIQGPVDAEAFAQYQGQLAQARARIDIASSELSGLKLKAQANQASSADLSRIKDLQSNLPKYEKAYQSLEEQTKLASSSKSSVREFTGNAAKFALTSVGIRAGINVLSQAVSGEGVDLGKALGFMGDPTFWTGTAGSFLGATLFTAIGNAVLPGSGAIMSALPGFLGAAVGYEVGSGNADRTNWTQLIASTAVSAAAFALIGGPLGIGASILAGMLVNKFFDKDEGAAPPSLEEYTPDWAQFNPMPPASAQIPVPDFVPPVAPPAPQVAPAEIVNPVPKTPEMPKADPKEVLKYQEEMQVHYQRYIKAVKDRNSVLADSEYALYKEAKNKLDSVRGYYGQ